MAAPFACSFNILYIYQAFVLLFHKTLHQFLSVSVHLSVITIIIIIIIIIY